MADDPSAPTTKDPTPQPDNPIPQSNQPDPTPSPTQSNPNPNPNPPLVSIPPPLSYAPPPLSAYFAAPPAPPSFRPLAPQFTPMPNYQAAPGVTSVPGAPATAPHMMHYQMQQPMRAYEPMPNGYSAPPPGAVAPPEISESEARAGLVCQVHSSDRSKFKLLYFDRVDDGGFGLCLQEDSAKTGKVTSAGMYFLGFPVYRVDHTLNSMAANKDPDSAFFKKLDGFQPCELTELKSGTHVFAVYGDNFFKSATYTMEVLSCEPFPEEKESLRDVEAQILTKRVELSKFETEYREVLAQFTDMTSRYTQEMQEIDELLKLRNEIHASYTTGPPIKRSSSRSRNRGHSKEEKKGDASVKEKKSTFRDGTKKKKWFNIHLKVDKRRSC